MLYAACNGVAFSLGCTGLPTGLPALDQISQRTASIIQHTTNTGQAYMHHCLAMAALLRFTCAGWLTGWIILPGCLPKGAVQPTVPRASECV
jgi:hypothetical protein